MCLDDRFRLVRLFLLRLHTFRFDIADPPRARFVLPIRMRNGRRGCSFLLAARMDWICWRTMALLGLKMEQPSCGSSAATHGDVEIVRALLNRGLKGGENEPCGRRFHSITQKGKKTA